MLLQPLGHLSVFRINELQTARNRLSHTPTTLPAFTWIAFVFSGLKRTEEEHPGELCKAAESPLITYRRAAMPAFLELGWSYRRIEAKTGVSRIREIDTLIS